ncbi:MAG: hypothetical protein LLF76_11560 [Planctomycetaceae bacterium]|nr:hypothetical protein [Planctomycetaceae bacterium]
MQTAATNTTLTDEQVRQMAAYIEDLLSRQIERLKRYDLDGAMRLAEEAKPLADTLADGKYLDRPGLEPLRDRTRGLYRELCLVIASQRQEVADKLEQIRTGLKTLGKYSGV